MKKKTYKRMQTRLLRETKKYLSEHVMRLDAESKIDEAEQKASYYKKRIRKIGENMETVNVRPGKAVAMVKWEISPEIYGTYKRIDRIDLLSEETIKKELAMRIAEGLLDQELIQFICKETEPYDPLGRFATIGAKVYVVPWELMPHQRSMELMQYVDNTSF